MSIYRCSLDEELIDKVHEMIIEDHSVYSKYKYVNGKYLWNKLSALLTRIGDLVRYLNSERMIIDTDGEFPHFILMEMLNYAEQMNTLTSELFEIFNLDIPSIIGSKNIFPNIGNEKANDNRYIKYLRSLVSIHPTNTNKHIKYGYQQAVEYSPYVRKGSSFNHILILGRAKDNVIINNEHDIEEQFVVRVYHSEVKRANVEEMNNLKNMLENNTISIEEYESLEVSSKTKGDTYIFIYPGDIIKYISDRYNILSILEFYKL